MKSFIRENTWLWGVSHGWGNGYIAIPKSSSWHGVNYNSIPVDVHGGLTWSSLVSDFCDAPDDIDDDSWIIGFDTAHSGDNLDSCSKAYVEAETENLLNQMIELDKYGFAKSQKVAICPHCGEAYISECADSLYCEVEKRRCTKCSKEFYCEIGE